MAMFQYFKRVDGQYPESKLPDPQGALTQEVPSRAISEIICLSCTRKFLVDRGIPNVLVDMISTDHRLNVESRHPFQVTCVDSYESSSAREIEFQHVTPINNVGVACLGHTVNSRNYFNEIFKNSNSRKFRPAKFLRCTVVQYCAYNTSSEVHVQLCTMYAYAP